MPEISKEEFNSRISRIQESFRKEGIEAMMVYGDEYRKENLRYVSDFWPIFERAACFIPASGESVLACAPEGEIYAREMSVWSDIRLVPDFACVTVPEEIDYPLASYSSLEEIIKEILGGGKMLGLAGIMDMPAYILERVKKSAGGIDVKDSARLLYEARMIKSESEIECLREAGKIACAGYEKLMEASIPGNSEVMAAGAAEGAARTAGAEAITFTVYGSGKRAETIIGRATDKVIEEGEMIMAALAVQYRGYVSTVEFPFVAGKASGGQKRFLEALFEASNTQLEYLKDGVRAKDMVRAVKDVFKKHGMSEYDVYPPMHGIGLAEAESPYPDENSGYSLRSGMCVNSDISIFGHPDGSNRIEEGFVIGDDGPETLTPIIRHLCAEKHV